MTKLNRNLSASVFASAIGMSDFVSAIALWRVKTGLDEWSEGGAATHYGKENEENAINAYELAQGDLVFNTGDNQEFIVHPHIKWLGCRPDGFTNKRLVEAKCPFRRMYHDIPDYYMPQLQGEMAITGVHQLDFIAWNRSVTRIWRVNYSPEYWEAMLVALKKFRASLNRKTQPDHTPKPTMPKVRYVRIK